MDFREGIEVCELQFVVDMDTHSQDRLGRRRGLQQSKITFELDEGVGAGFGIDEVFANPFKVGYVDSYCFAFANFWCLVVLRR